PCIIRYLSLTFSVFEFFSSSTAVLVKFLPSPPIENLHSSPTPSLCLLHITLSLSFEPHSLPFSLPPPLALSFSLCLSRSRCWVIVPRVGRVWSCAVFRLTSLLVAMCVCVCVCVYVFLC